MALADGQLDALFNNGAFGLPGAVEDLSREALRAQFETNLFGWLELTNALLPYMRKQGSGRIIQNSSVLGFVALPYRGAYVASKFALEGLSDTLRLELKGSGIDVSLIEPGPIESKFRHNAELAFRKFIRIEGSAHEQQYRAMEQRLQKKGHATAFTLPAEAVLDYLQDHPDLFLEHPEALDEIELPGPPRPVASLHHWQLRRWRGRALHQQTALDRLHQVAADNAAADRLLHRFCETLLGAEDRRTDTLERLLAETFDIDAARVVPLADLDGETRGLLSGWLDNPVPHCGRIHDTVRERLFGDALPQTGSAALIAVPAEGDNASRHVVALGRHLPDGFNPAQGTHFLEQIGELAGAFLGVTPSQTRD